MDQKDWEWDISYQIFKTQILVNILRARIADQIIPTFFFFFNSVIYKGGCGVP